MKRSTHKRLFAIILSFAMIFGAIPMYPNVASAEAGDIVIVNSGFEDAHAEGETPGWSFVTKNTISTVTINEDEEYVHSGIKSLYFNNSSDKEQLTIKSDMTTVTPGESYIARAFVNVVSQSHSIGYQVYFYNDEGVAVQPIVAALNFPATALGVNKWTEIKVPFVVPADATQVQLRFNSGEIAITEAYFDDVSIDVVVEEPEEPIDPSDLLKISNPGFEDALVDGKIPNWSNITGSGIMELDSIIKKDGENSLHFYDNSDAMFRVISDNIAITPGETYIARADAFILQQTHRLIFEVLYFDKAGTKISEHVPFYVPGGLELNVWTEVENESTAPANAAYAKIAFYSGDVSRTNVYFDDVTLEVAPEFPLTFGKAENLGQPVVASRTVGAVIENNEVYMASYGSPATFYVLDALTGEVKFSQDLVGLTNVLAITIGYDDNVYFNGPENGNLYRYLPDEKKIEDLGHNTTGHKEVYGFASTDDGLVYGGTFDSKTSGATYVYDIEAKEFTNLGSLVEGQKYVQGIGVTDKYVYMGTGNMNYLYKFDRDSSAEGGVSNKRKIELPSSTPKDGGISKFWEYNGVVFMRIGVSSFVVFDLETDEVLNEMYWPDHPQRPDGALSAPSPDNENILYFRDALTGKLSTYDMTNHTTSFVPGDVLISDEVRVLAYDWIEKDGKSLLGMVTQHLDYMLYNPEDNSIITYSSKLNAQAINIQSMEMGPDHNLYLGGFQRSLTIYDPINEGIILQEQKFPQIEGMGFLGDTMYFGTYGGAVIYEYDTTQPSDAFKLGENPSLAKSIAEGQSRPFAFETGDDKLFIATVADYGLLDGAMTIYDSKTKQWAVHKGIVKDQGIIGLAYQDGLIYGGTTIRGGNGIDPVATEAKMFVWDVNRKVKKSEFELVIPGVAHHEMIGELSIGPDGLLWGASFGKTPTDRNIFTIFALDPKDSLKVVKSTFLHSGSATGSTWKPFHLRWGKEGILFSTVGRHVTAIDTETMAYKTLANNINLMTIDDYNNLYYTQEANLYRIALGYENEPTDPTIDELSSQLEAYINANEVRGPLVNQLRNSLKQAKHHLDKGSERKAADFVEKFLKHMNNQPMQKHISEDAKADLAKKAEDLINYWGK